MSNSTTCGVDGEEFCAFIYGATGSFVMVIIYSCFRGCIVKQNDVNTYPTDIVPKMQVSDPSEYDSPCSICIEDIMENDYICKLPCGHYFHPDCIHQWLSYQSVCPLCKIEVVVQP